MTNRERYEEMVARWRLHCGKSGYDADLVNRSAFAWDDAGQQSMPDELKPLFALASETILAVRSMVDTGETLDVQEPVIFLARVMLATKELVNGAH